MCTYIHLAGDESSAAAAKAAAVQEAEAAEAYIYTFVYIHRRFLYKGDTSTHAQDPGPRVALEARGIYRY